MELTAEYFDSVIGRLEGKISDLENIIQNKSATKSLSMSIKDVRDEYGSSEYTQRMAREKGDLAYRLEGYKDIKYSRVDVENWINKKTIKAE